jgi:hypothetical protein
MFTTVRIYTGMPGVAAQIAAKKDLIEKAMRTVPGFAGYRMIATGDGLTSVTICETKDGCDTSAKVAAAWLKENLPGVHVNAPTIVTGESLISFGAKPSK